jgi:hypothetical protein
MGRGQPGRGRESLWIDFGFLLAYGTFLTLALRAVHEMAATRHWRRLHALGGAAIWFGAIGAGFDALENACLLLALGAAGAALPPLATIFASCKFAFLAMAIAYIVAGLARRAVGRQTIRDI